MSDLLLLARAFRQLQRLGHRLHDGHVGFASHGYVWRVSADIAEDLDYRQTLYGVRIVVESALPPDTMYLDRRP